MIDLLGLIDLVGVLAGRRGTAEARMSLRVGAVPRADVAGFYFVLDCSCRSQPRAGGVGVTLESGDLDGFGDGGVDIGVFEDLECLPDPFHGLTGHTS
jgi:hypothetical protein